MMKNLFSFSCEKIKSLLLATFFLGCYGNFSAQIVYQDINPDFSTTMSSTQSSAFNLRPIDFNNDGTPEYSFRWDDWDTEWFMHMSSMGTNEFILKGTATNAFGGRFLQPLMQNEAIDASKNWGNSSPEPFIGESTADANFLGLGDRYIGTKFMISGNIYYGWVLVNFSLVNNARVLTVKSYAYNSTPNQAILAGQTTLLATHEINSERGLEIYPNPVKDFIHVKGALKNNSSASVINNLGQSIIKDAAVENNTINVTSLPKGVYFLEVNDKNNSKTKRVKFIKK